MLDKQTTSNAKHKREHPIELDGYDTISARAAKARQASPLNRTRRCCGFLCVDVAAASFIAPIVAESDGKVQQKCAAALTQIGNRAADDTDGEPYDWLKTYAGTMSGTFSRSETWPRNARLA